MRVLKFIVNGQSLQKDPNCDFSGIIRESIGYLVAEFSFDSAWKDCTIAASFWHFGEEHAVLVQNNRCMIPDEALRGFSVGVTLRGVKKGYSISTNKAIFEQGG